MPEEHVISIDPTRQLAEEPDTGHNRWHEDLHPALEVDPGDTVIYETRDAFDGQLGPGSTADDVANLDLNLVHPLTGPVYVRGAEPGDLLEIQVQEIEADPWEQWGYTVEVPGFGFLRDEFEEPFIVHWRLRGNEYAESDELPGVRIRCNPHLASVGLAPSAELRRAATEREAEIADRGGFSLPPEPAGAVPAGDIAEEAIRTVPPREVGGNLDIKQLSPGATVLIPVYREAGWSPAGTSTLPRATARRAARPSKCAPART